MLFSEKYNIEKYWEKEWFNPVLETDVPLFIDPYLIENSDIPEFKNGRQKLNNFFKEVIKKIVDYHAKDQKKKVFEIMKKVLIFPEVYQLCLGYSLDTKGSGTGGKFASDVFHAIVDYVQELGMDETNFTHLEILTFFSKGIAHDGISDITANILKEEIVQYTQRICKENKIPLTKMPVTHLKFNYDTFLWEDSYIDLPLNPHTNEAIFLIPKVFLRRSPTLEYSEFCRFLINQESEYLRQKLNITLQDQLDKEAILKIIKNNPKKLNNYFDSFYGEGKTKKDYYDYIIDKKFLYHPKHIVPEILKLMHLPQFKDSYNNKELFEFVKDLVNHFKHLIEHQGEYKILRNPLDNEPFKEPFIQEIFYCTISKICEEHNIEVSRESRAANGRIEFKFSQGVKSRTHLEIKFANNKNIISGYQKQLTEYMFGEKIVYGVYMIIYFIESEQKIIDEIKKLDLGEKYKNLKIEIMDIDARIKPSPSNL